MDEWPEQRKQGRDGVPQATIQKDRSAIRLGILSAYMNPKLAAVAGPRQGNVIPLGEEPLSVGRDTSNQICLASMWVSRRHCVIERQGARVTIADLGSHNGTFVNGVPIKERVLAHGDQVRIGDSVFLVLLQEVESPPCGDPVELNDQRIVAGRTIELSQAVLPPAGAAAPPATGRAARDFAVLMRISTAINSVRGVEALERRLLESIFEVVPAERGAVLLLGKGTDEIAGIFGLEKDVGSGRAVKVSRTIVLRVVRERVSILCNDVRDNEDFGAAQSLLAANVHSVLAVPLSFDARTLGVLYLDSSNPKARFDEGHLGLLTAVAGIASVALAETLLESELFGHERGAFTGAVAQKKGRLEVAEGGTVFLDEVGELAPHLQAKLLRVLQEHAFERVGGTRSIKVDARVITATNRDLKEMTKTGEFREDLFYRINVVSLDVPPLRDRREDVPLLARSFAQKYGERCNRRVAGVSAEALECLMNYEWPGNVRELENAVERAVVLGSSDVIRPEELPESILEAGSRQAPCVTRYHEAVVLTKKDVILKAFKEAGGNYVETARLLDVHPNYLHRLIRNMNLKGVLKKQEPLP